MNSTSETGHAKNVANFNNLIAAVTALGANYAPSKVSLKVASLQALLTASNDCLNLVITKNIAYNNAVNSRIILFNMVRPLATRLIAALNSSEANFELLKDAKTINRKIQGKRAIALEPVAEGTEAPKSNSVSQQSFDLMLQHFTALVNLIDSEPSYQPAETDLKIDTLNELIENLNSVNNEVISAHIIIRNARIARTNALYKKPNGLVDIALSVKEYIKSVYGARSAEYKQVFKINFRTFTA